MQFLCKNNADCGSLRLENYIYSFSQSVVQIDYHFAHTTYIIRQARMPNCFHVCEYKIDWVSETGRFNLIKVHGLC